MQAFHGDETFKATVQQRLDEDLARHAIEEGPTAWRDDRGSIAGSLLRGTTLAKGPAELGIPDVVLAILDHLGGHLYFTWVSSTALAPSFLNAIRPGADLTSVPDALIARMTGAIDLNRASGDDKSDDHAAYATMLAAGMRAPEHVIALIDQWLHVRSREAVRASGWTEAEEEAAQETLSRLWDETADARAKDEPLNYPAMFREADGALADGYEKALSISNASFEADAAQITRWFLDILRAA